MSFYALAPKELRAMIAEEEKKKKQEEEEARKAEKEAEAAAEDTDSKPGKEVSPIFEHPQSRLFTKMLGLAGAKAVPTLASDPTSDAAGVKVMDRKLEEDEQRLKKDNTRWKWIVYLTVVVCLVIFCLVVTQVVSSVTSSAKPLPNIDVSEPRSAAGAPRSESLVASLASLPTHSRTPEPDVPESAETDVVEIETMVTKMEAAEQAVQKEEEERLSTDLEGQSADLEGQSGTLEYVPVPLDDEEKEKKERREEGEGNETTQTPRASTRRPPLFMPIMLEQRGVEFENPLPQFIRHHFMSLNGPHPQLQIEQAPFQGLTDPPRHTFLEFLLNHEPATLPPFLNQETVVVAELQQDDMPPTEENPFFGDMLRGMKALLQTVKPLLEDEPLPEKVSLRRLLRPAAQFAGGKGGRAPFQRALAAPQGRGFPSQGRGFPPRFPQLEARRPNQQRGIHSPPVAFRPGPLRTPVSIVPPQIANQHRFPPPPANQHNFPPRPTNQRAFPPRGPALPPGFHQSQPFSRPQFPPRLHESSSSRHYNNNPHHQQQNLVGNHLYNYPNSATGIQDIIQHIRQQRPSQNGHTPLQPHSPSSHLSSNDRFNNHGGFHVTDNHYGDSHHGNDGYSGPIYPPGYEEQQVQASSPEQPFHLMLDVYPVDNSDRYSGDHASSPDLPQDVMVLPGVMQNSLDNMFTGDMPLPEGRAFHMHHQPSPQGVPAPHSRGFPMQIEFAEGRNIPQFPPREMQAPPQHVPNHQARRVVQPMPYVEEHPLPKILHRGGEPHHPHMKLGFRNERPPVNGKPFNIDNPWRSAMVGSPDGLVLPSETEVPHYVPAPQGMHFSEHTSDVNSPREQIHILSPAPHPAQHFRPPHMESHQERGLEESGHHNEAPNFAKDMNVAFEAVHSQGNNFAEQLPSPEPLVFRNDNEDPPRPHDPNHNDSPHMPPSSQEPHHPYDMIFGEARPSLHHVQQEMARHPEMRHPQSASPAEADPFHMDPPMLHQQHLSEPREVTFMHEQEGVARSSRTPLYKLLLGGGPHMQQDRLLGVPEGRSGEAGHARPQGIYFPQEKGDDDEFSRPGLSPAEGRFTHPMEENTGEMGGARRFDGNPFLLF